jgi:hypothetical protein
MGGELELSVAHIVYRRTIVLFSFDSGIRVFPENAEYPFPDGTVYLHYEGSHYSVLVPIYSDIDVHDIETLCQFKKISTDWT